jgi:2-polyprenyl-3-methyl-5-hydroxy-6-metoxy-1,4-benzoquinol methylase
MNTQYNELSAGYSSKPAGYYEISRIEMLPYVPPSAQTILEVGCGSGGFGSLLKRSSPGRSVWGIEPDHDAALSAAMKLDRVIEGTFSVQLPELKEQRFDVICFNDVLEHMANPERALLECKQFLNPQGLVVASLPNILFFYQISKILIEQDWKYEDAGIMDSTHLRFFTKKSIIRLFESSGYEISRIDGINPSFGFKYRALNLLLGGHLKDWRFVQFAVQATPIRTTLTDEQG